MKPENFARIISTMRPAVNRIDAEIGLIKAMRAHRESGSHEAREELLEGAGAFYARYSSYALESGPAGSFTALLNAWVDIGIAYDRDIKGHDFDEIVFDMYRVVTKYRIHMD